jgi:hypothetical protein
LSYIHKDGRSIKDFQIIHVHAEYDLMCILTHPRIQPV